MKKYFSAFRFGFFSIRVMPHHQNTGAFFVALFRKLRSESTAAPVEQNKRPAEEVLFNEEKFFDQNKNEEKTKKNSALIFSFRISVQISSAPGTIEKIRSSFSRTKTSMVFGNRSGLFFSSERKKEKSFSNGDAGF